MRIRDDIDWLPLVIDTEKWMREEGAHHDNERNVRGHIIRQEWEDRFNLEYGVTVEDWLACLTKMYQAGFIVGCDPGRGFYLSNPIDGPTSVTRLVNYVTTLCETVDKIITAMAEGGHWNDLLPGFKGRMRIGDLDNLAGLLEGAQLQLTEQVRTVLLEAKARFENENDLEENPLSGSKIG